MNRDHKEIIRRMERALAGEPTSGLLDMGERVYDAWYSPIFDQNGAVNGVIGGAVNIIERHHGSMRFHSEYGHGSTFGFELPLV